MPRLSRCNQSRLRYEQLEDRLPFAANLSVTIESLTQNVVPGEEVSYSIHVSNTGEEDVLNASVTERLNGLEPTGWIRETPFPALIDLPNLGRRSGFTIKGAGIGDSAGSYVRFAGDLNGDDIGDLLIGAPDWRADLADDWTGAMYAVFGTAQRSTETLELSTLDGTNGFLIPGIAESDGDGETACRFGAIDFDGAGDLNADGLDDIVIECRGEFHVIFGKHTGFEAIVDLTALDGSNGFVVTGANENGEIIFSGAFVGDMNGDAVDDLLLGSYQFGQLGPGLGTLYVLFGSDQGFDETVHVSTLDGSNGFTIFGDEGAGQSIVPAGDINNDGRADVLIGAGTNDLTGVGGKAYVLFGDSNAPPLVDLSELNGQNGFVVPGDGRALISSGAGDVNGDGFDDMLFSPFSRDEVYVVFGKGSPFASRVVLSGMDEYLGFRITGSRGDGLGMTMSPGGDLNGDGVDDIVLGAPLAPNFDAVGNVYVVFGSRESFGKEFGLSGIDGRNGFVMRGGIIDRAGDSAARAGASVAVGDVNGDGLADVVVGAPFAADDLIPERGFTYVVYGRHTNLVGSEGTISDLVDIGVGESVTYFVSARVAPGTSEIADISVHVSLPSSQIDSDESDNVASYIFRVAQDDAVPGDLDLDGEVAFTDFLILSSNFGRDSEDVRPSDGDIDGDGLVGFGDFLILAANFGKKSGVRGAAL